MSTSTNWLLVTWKEKEVFFSYLYDAAPAKGG